MLQPHRYKIESDYLYVCPNPDCKYENWVTIEQIQKIGRAICWGCQEILNLTEEIDTPKIDKEILDKDVKTIEQSQQWKWGKVSLQKLEHPSFFSHLYGRDTQIKIIKNAIRLAIKTKLKKRYHVLLHGPPGCGKTDVLCSIGKSLGEEGIAYLMIDATTMTQSGVLEKLINTLIVPPVLLIEEIEKAEKNMLRWLLGLLDSRGQIRRLNYRAGEQLRNCPMFCMATANDLPLFEKVMHGALASRFSYKLYCGSPDVNMMRKILQREIRSVNGNFAWVEPTIQFCMDEMKMTDPRQIISVCLCGGDQLLNNNYQQTLRKAYAKV